MMSAVIDLITGDFAQRLGWTLLHSVWQGLAAFSVVYIILRMVPAQKSQVRYLVACAGLVLVLLSSAITFSSLEVADQVGTSTQQTGMSYVTFVTYPSEDVSVLSQILPAIQSFLAYHMPLIITAWVVGFMFFAVRLMMGLTYSQKLISSADLLDNEWTLYIKETAARLGIKRIVSLAQSAVVKAPVVIGYLRPVILVPVGMFSGLSTEQLQTIFLHELAHVKRYDYLINVLQSVIEVVFFFNPFVWTLSNIIRREREYCCDDLVVRQHGGVRAYAHALARLAENSLLTPALALPVAGNKNQLLNRIRRIMEKSVANHSVKSRVVVPAILLLAGLFCISWLGVQKNEDISAEHGAAAQDTIIEKNRDGARYSRRSIITFDANGQPHEEVVEEFEGDENLRPLMEKQFESLQDLHSLMAPLPPSVHDPALPFRPMSPDTIPPLNFPDKKQWEEFSRSFEEHFGKEFENLFAWREGQVSEMMKEFEETFNSEDWASGFHFELPPLAFDSARQFFDKESFKNLEEELEELRSHSFDRFGILKDRMDGADVKTDRYEDVLLDQLRKDGYLSEDETIQSLEWNDELLKVNGKQIKEADEEKYREINRQYFNRKPLDKFN